MNRVRVYLSACSVAACAALAVGCVDTVNTPFTGTPGVVVRVVFDGSPADTMDVPMTDPSTINTLAQYIQTGQGSHILIGPIAKGIGYGGNYPFHFIPDSVRVTDAATAGCDVTPIHTAADVSAFFQNETGNANAASAIWCPSSSRPIAMSSALQIGNSSR